jgi:XTP/dITP diphosphohydrolase
MRELLIATTNAGKIREILFVLERLPLKLVTLGDLPPIPEPEETGATFAENAALKAHYYAALSGLPTVAEDSGLVIDALGGRPGIHSARYPGDTYPDKFRNLYSELEEHAKPWTARYVAAVSVAHFACDGVVEGWISPEPKGANGFGYDPIFYCPELGKTFGEATDAEKLTVSHRARAFKKLRTELRTSL